MRIMRSLFAGACLSLAAMLYAPAASADPVPPARDHLHESRIGKDWSYIPNYNLVCDHVGCCGEPTPETPNKDACGPEFWRYLNADSCSGCTPETGGQQSPINFATMGNHTLTFHDMTALTGGDVAAATPNFTDNKCVGKLELLANTYEVTFDKACDLAVTVLGKKWKLVQWHVHNAEHAVNGLYYPLEIHMVHKNDAGDYLVVGMFITVGETNRYFDQLFHDDPETRMAPLDPYELIPEDGQFWHYQGGLTTPPCQPGKGKHVEWFVYETPDTITTQQMYTFTSYFSGLAKSYDGKVNRPLQDVLPTTKVYVNHGDSLINTQNRLRLRH